METLEVNQNKVIETKSLLLEIIREPLNFKGIEALLLALKSQAGLAKFSDTEKGILSCSLNTLKSASESLLDRGFKELDELRINAKDAIEEATIGNKATKTTRTGLRQAVNELESKLNTSRKSNFLLTTMITELRSELNRMAHSNDTPEEKKTVYQEINKRVEAKLSYLNHSEQ